MGRAMFVIGIVAVVLFDSRGEVVGQGPVFEARVGMAWHGDAACSLVSRERGLSAGIEVRTRGTWVVSGAVDLLLDAWRYACTDIGYETMYGGQRFEIKGSHSGVRARGAVGRAIVLGGFRSMLTAGAGLIPSTVEKNQGGTDVSWQPWYGGTLTVRIPDSGIGLQLELGRHRIPQRYYVDGTDVLAAEVHHWEHLIRLGMTFPL